MSKAILLSTDKTFFIETKIRPFFCELRSIHYMYFPVEKGVYFFIIELIPVYHDNQLCPVVFFVVL